MRVEKEVKERKKRVRREGKDKEKEGKGERKEKGMEEEKRKGKEREGGEREKGGGELLGVELPVSCPPWHGPRLGAFWNQYGTNLRKIHVRMERSGCK